MKKNTILLLFLLVSVQSFAQIDVLPKVNAGQTIKPARITTVGDNGLGIGANSFIHYFLNSSGTKNTGLGTQFNTAITTESYLTDGKLHIRHNSTVSNDTGTDGPHLILDEDQSNDYARLRFRQSTISGFTYTRGTRYWDIAGFANGAATTYDFLNINHSTSGTVFSVRGDGNTSISGFTKLGGASPSIKTKKVTGSLPNVGSIAVLPHGLEDHSKILSVTIYQHNTAYDRYEQLNNILTNIDAFGVEIDNFLNAAAYKMFIVYEE